MNKIAFYIKIIKTAKGSSLILLSFFFLMTISCKNKANRQHASKDYYTCPMHRQIKQDDPGICPICKMELVEESSLLLHQIGIKVDDIVRATNETVLSTIKTVKPSYSTIPITVNAKGTITYDTRNFTAISSRYKGRIEKMYIHFRFERVSKGQKLFDIYSPEMISAQQDFIFLLPSASTQLIENAKQKLHLLGLTEEQLKELETSGKISHVLSVYSPVSGYVFENKIMPLAGDGKEEMGKEVQAEDNSLPVKEGMYVNAGQEIFKVVNTEKVWALIKVFAADIALIKDGQPVTISSESLTYNGKVDLIEPFYEGVNKALNVRVYLGNEKSNLKINQWVNAEIETGNMKALWIPRSSVLDMGKQKVVFVKKGNAFVVHEIKTGIENKEQVRVESGIDEHSEIAEHAQYLVDSESFLQIEN